LRQFPFGSVPEQRDAPGVSLLKPICGTGGDEVALRENLASMLDQDHPGYEVLFGLQDARDPARAVVEAMCRNKPFAKVVTVDPAAGPNRKASVLAALQAASSHDILVVSDQDMRVDRSYLRTVAMGFHNPRVGLVTCPYRTRSARDLGGILEALSVNADFIPSVLVARRLEGLSFALGATMAVRRTALEDIGGFQALAPFLADDYQLGNRVKRAGWRLVLSPYVVDNVVGETSLGEWFAHQLRWARTYRVSRPGGYFGSVLMNGTAFGLALVASCPAAWPLLVLWLGLRVSAVRFAQARMGAPEVWAWLAPLKDVAGFAMWLLALVGNDVRWGGRTFRLASDGTMAEVP